MTRSITIATILAVAACNAQEPPPDEDAEVELLYPDLGAIYTGDQGLYRGCGPNGGVCHNGNEFPNLDSIGSILANIDVACNQKRDAAVEIDDLCERHGDKIQIGTEKLELAFVEPWHPETWSTELAIWRMVLRVAPAVIQPAGEMMQVWREVPGGTGGPIEVPFVPLSLALLGYQVDAEDPSGRSILLGMIPAVNFFFEESGVARPDRLHYGDPNMNGTFGADLGGRLIKPGEPERSYLLRRLTDPTLGPLMPRANCCSWTKQSLRALWCWVDGLAPDGANAEAPIDYDACSAMPPVELLYPTVGPDCEAQGLCPVEAGGGTGEPTFPSIYAEILTTRCAGFGCHDQGEPPPGGVDLRTRTAAFETLSAKVVPGDPVASTLWQVLNDELCAGPGCKRMPLGRPMLEPDELARIRAWIEAGALEDGP